MPLKVEAERLIEELYVLNIQQQEELVLDQVECTLGKSCQSNVDPQPTTENEETTRSDR